MVKYMVKCEMRSATFSGPFQNWGSSRSSDGHRFRLKRALQVDGVIRGLHEVSKYVEACKAQVVFLAESCSWAAMAAMAAMAHVVFVGGTD